MAFEREGGFLSGGVRRVVAERRIRGCGLGLALESVLRSAQEWKQRQKLESAQQATLSSAQG